MVLNFQRGGAAINVFCRQHGIDLHIVDAGVNADLTDLKGIIHRKLGLGTQNFLKASAMTSQQCQQAILHGKDLILAETESSVFALVKWALAIHLPPVLL